MWSSWNVVRATSSPVLASLTYNIRVSLPSTYTCTCHAMRLNFRFTIHIAISLYFHLSNQSFLQPFRFTPIYSVLSCYYSFNRKSLFRRTTKTRMGKTKRLRPYRRYTVFQNNTENSTDDKFLSIRRTRHGNLTKYVHNYCA